MDNFTQMLTHLLLLIKIAFILWFATAFYLLQAVFCSKTYLFLAVSPNSGYQCDSLEAVYFKEVSVYYFFSKAV